MPRQPDEGRLFSDHPKELDDEHDSRLVGKDSAGDVHYYDPVQQRLAPMGDDGVDWDAGMDVRQSLGEAIEELGESVGWEGLSAFAREHVERDDK